MSAPTAAGVTGAVLADDDPRWTAFVRAHPRAQAYHQPAWSRLIADCYGHRAFVVALLESEGAVRAGLPVHEVRLPTRRPRWVALPFSDECAPLVSTVDDLPVLQSALQEQRRRASVGLAQVRGLLPGPGARSAAVAQLQSVDLTCGLDNVRAGFGSTARRGLARARRHDLRLRIGASREDLLGQYFNLHVLTRHRLGVPVQPRRYFAMLWDRILEPAQGFLVLVEERDQVVAGAVFLEAGGTTTYKYGASNDRGREIGANFLLFDEVLAAAAQRGGRSLDLGRTDVVDGGLQRFKKSWGATTVPLIHTNLADHAVEPVHRPVDARVRTALRRSPPFVSRFVGHTLYRFTA